jgi:5-methylcytosine-specific restriction endonuclease McrA
MSSNSKTCKVCGETKIIEEFPTYGVGGYRRGYCYTCHLEKKRLYYEANKDAILTVQREYGRRNRDKVSERSKKYRADHPDKYHEYNRLYWALTKEEQEAKRKAKYEANPELKERKRRIALQWAKDNPEKMVANKHRRRARLKSVGGSYTAEEWQALKEQYGNRCLRCDRVEPEITLTVDHVVPLSKGGANSIDNIQPLYRSCNSTKHTELADYRPIPVAQAA